MQRLIQFFKEDNDFALQMAEHPGAAKHKQVLNVSRLSLSPIYTALYAKPPPPSSPLYITRPLIGLSFFLLWAEKGEHFQEIWEAHKVKRLSSKGS